ncbi:MAG: hypothetical protein HZA22_07195 [Nitrospirae bacterium]|nr:hypothetical protein [Nitrospirota bacterium]MBI5696720.1 hypothetical protein [Nitrospirota bacterium]
MALDERGGSTSSSLIYLLIATIIIYGVVKLVPPYMDYYAMEDEISQQLSLAQINTQDVIYNDLKLKMDELDIPVESDTITLSRDHKGTLTVDIYWTTTVDFGYGFVRDFPFEISVSSGETEEE